MAPDDYFVAADLDSLRREGELLALENAFLKGRVAALEQELAEIKKRGAGVTPAASAPGDEGKS